MAGPSTVMAQAMVNHLMRGATGAYTLTGPWKVKLWTTNPDFDAGTGGTELTGSGYTAGGQSITMTAANWNAAATDTNGKKVTNIAVPSWTASAADWSGPITGASLMNASNALMWGAALDNARTVGNGDTFRLSAAAMALTLDKVAAAGIGDFWKAEILDHFTCTDRAYTAPTGATGAYIALYTVAPNFYTGAGGTEVTTSGTNYGRLAINMATAWDTADASGIVDNTAEIAFPASTGTWGTVVAAALVKESAGAITEFYCGKGFTGVALTAGDTFKIAAGDWDVQIL